MPNTYLQISPKSCILELLTDLISTPISVLHRVRQVNLSGHEGHRKRIRDRVRKETLRNFFDYQVLEYALTFVIPYKDTNPIAHRLINKFGSLTGVLEASEYDIACVEGMGEVSAHFLSNIIGIYECYQLDKAKKIPIICSPYDAYKFFRGLLNNKMLEDVYIACLTPKGKIIATELISEGGTGDALVSMRAITDKVARTGASNVVVAHNHPKGKSTPSEADNKFTKALVTTLAINGCHLLDHIIIGEKDRNDYEEFYSYRERHLIEEYLSEISYLVDNKVSQPMAPYIVDEERVKAIHAQELAEQMLEQSKLDPMPMVDEIKESDYEEE